MTSATDESMSLRETILPRPVFSLVLLVTWLLAAGSLSAGSILLGGVLAVAVPWLFRDFWPEAPALQSISALLGYLVVVGFDIVIANLSVAKLILGPTARLRPDWLEIPLDIEHPYAISILASTISLTPGTVSSNLSGDQKTLLVHILDCEDPDKEIRRIKARYEAPLKEMFE
jgi:multicomponent K+:H+ antiporter subunit E